MQQVVSPLLSQESHVEFVPLQLFARVRHHLVEGALQQMFSPDEQPGGIRGEQKNIDVTSYANGPCLRQRIIVTSEDLYSCDVSHDS